MRLNCYTVRRAQFAVAVTRLALESLQLCPDVTFARFTVMILSETGTFISNSRSSGERGAVGHEMCHVKCRYHKGYGTLRWTFFPSLPWNFLRNLIRGYIGLLASHSCLIARHLRNFRPKTIHVTLMLLRHENLTFVFYSSYISKINPN